ncbi:MAG: filamentous hemagglutinin family protein [Pseudomonadota bacterium]
MNANRYLLVFSPCLGMRVPVAETARRRGHGKDRSRRSVAFRLLALVAALMGARVVMAAAPVPAMTSTTLPSGGVVASGTANINPATSKVNGFTTQFINQSSQNAIINWQSFNVGSKAAVQFNLPSTTASTLNRVMGAEAVPSVIQGRINAGVLQSDGSLLTGGHIYLINQNGIIFDKGAQVNVGSLTASSLDITDDLFNAGINSAPGTAYFQGTTGFVLVDTDATLTTASGGRVMLLAPDNVATPVLDAAGETVLDAAGNAYTGVVNRGVITTPDGQAILAAGQKVYLIDSADPAGLLVEVDAGGTATNLGEMVAERGNVTLVGLAVNQMGRITATTSVRSGGSILLQARDGGDSGVTYQAASSTSEEALVTHRAGAVVLGEGSVTEVQPEVEDNEATTDEQGFTASRVDIQGRTVEIYGSILAPAGTVNLSAVVDPSGATTGLDDDTRVYLGENALIDVSGLDNVAMSMESNQLSIQLYSEQLKDAPLLRGGELFGETVYLDAREGTALFDLSALLALQTHTVAERSSVGGTVNISSAGDIVTRQGSLIDVSGGSLAYAEGYLRTSQLVYQGRLVDIADASPDVAYEGLSDVYSITDGKWGVTRAWSVGSDVQGNYQPGYTEGAAAGSVSFTATRQALTGELRARTTTGTYQREAPPAGGQFTLDLAPYSSVSTALVFAAENLALPEDFGADTELDESRQATLVLGTDFLEAGFDRVATTAGQTTVEASLRLAAGGSLSLTAEGQDQGITVNADITLPGGTLTLTTDKSTGQIIRVADGVTLSTAGLWTNDSLGLEGALTAPVALHGGAITLSATGDVVLGQGSLLDVSAGAWLRLDGSLAGGDGGALVLKAGNGSLTLDGELRGYGFAEGGSLSLSANQNIQVGGSGSAAGDGWLWLPADFFGQGGFNDFTVATLRGNSEVGNPLDPDNPAGLLWIGVAGERTEIAPQVQVMQLGQEGRYLASGASLDAVTQRVTALDSERAPVNLNFNASAGSTNFGSVVVQADTLLATDPGGSISIKAGGDIWVFGTLSAAAGSLNLEINQGFQDTSVPYEPGQGIWIGADARLLAQGAYIREVADGSGLIDAQVLDAGSITLTATNKGYVVVEEGAVLDVSGVAGQADVFVQGGYQRQTLNGAAGSIAIAAREGLLLDGTFLGKAGGSGAPGGELSLSLTGSYTNDAPDAPAPFPDSAHVLTLTQDLVLAGEGLTPSDADAWQAYDAQFNGQGRISVAQIENGGFENLSLASYLDRGATQTGEDRIALDTRNGVLTLDLAGNLRLDTPLLTVDGDGSAVLNTGHSLLTNASSGEVALANLVDAAQIPQAAGTGNLTLNAQWIDVAGKVAITGVAHTTIASQLDIQGYGLEAGEYIAAVQQGWLAASGDLTLSARQVYPASNADFQVRLPGAGATLTVQSSGAADTPVLSAGGRLTLNADTLVQAGVLKAPLGSIILEAGDSLTLAAGSLTSVSAEGQTIPFGTTNFGGENWLAPVAGVGENVTDPPEKAVRLDAPNVDIQAASGGKAAAVVDLSGGGELMAYEWIPGIGGSTDVLAQEGVYAILPSQKGNYAPYDYDYSAGSSLKAGEAVYLSGVPGLADGLYTLLPARYALVPGAYMVRVNGDYATPQPGQALILSDGSNVVAGYRANLGSGSREATWSSYQVTAGSLFDAPADGEFSRAPSEYLVSLASTYFTDLAVDNGTLTPILPDDAGHLIIAASASLTLAGTLATEPEGEGRGALVDIVADQMRVVAEKDAGLDPAILQLSADELNGLGAASLLLGGTRESGEEGFTVSTGAARLTLANDADHGLAAPDVILVATDTLTLASGAVLAASDGEAPTDPLLLSGDGALVRVSAAAGDIERSGSGADATLGRLELAADASLRGKAIALDATYHDALNPSVSRLGDNLVLTAGGTLNLGASRISLGEPNPGAEAGLVLPADLAGLANLEQLVLRSYSTVDLHGALDFGNGGLDLRIQAGGLAGHGVGDKTLTARSLTLSNPAGSSDTPSSAHALGVDDLILVADAIQLGADNAGDDTAHAFSFQGFSSVTLDSATDITAVGTGSLELGSDALFQAGRLTAATGADYAINATGDLTVSDGGSAADTAGLGARLALNGASVRVSTGLIDLTAGQLSLTASSGDVTVESAGRLQARAHAQTFSDVTAYAPAGAVTLTADSGDVVVTGTLDVSGDVGADGAGSDAGLVSLNAASGTVAVTGTLLAEAGTDGLGGRFHLDALYANPDPAAASNDFSGLNDVLEAGGFRGERILRLRQGNVTIAAADGVRTEIFELTADGLNGTGGLIDVNGSVIARGDDGQAGHASLYAAGNLTVHDGALLDAGATAADEDGGRVTLGTTTGWLDIQAGSRIDVSAGADGTAGVLHLRAPRNAGNNDLNITSLAGDLSQAGSIEAEGFRVYADTSISSTDAGTTGTWYSEAKNFMDDTAAIETRLGVADDNAFQLMPGIEVDSATSLTLAADWSLHAWGYDPVTGAVISTTGAQANPGVLTLRSAGDLTLTNSLSDGFSSALTTGTLQAGQSWSYRLVAGGDLTSANPLAVSTTGTGNFTLGDTDSTVELIRTGTGRIDIAAGGNLSLTNGSTAADTSVIYTAGRLADSLAGFVNPTSALYGTEGGGIDIRVAGDITGKVNSSTSQQLVNNWLFRQGYLNSDGTYAKLATWYVRPDLFKSGVATFGGGDVRVQAGGDITRFSAAVATTGRVAENVDPETGLEVKSDPVILGGGDLLVRAGGDLLSGVYHLGDGQGVITAGGEIKAASDSFGLVLSLQDASFRVLAGGDLLVEAAINPTITYQSKTNALSGVLDSNSAYFYTFGEDSGIDLTSLAGKVDLLTDYTRVDKKVLGNLWNSYAYTLNYGPAKVAVTAFDGDINIGDITLYPSANASLSLLAADGVAFNAITMPDADPGRLPSLLAPAKSLVTSAANATTTAIYLKGLLAEHAASPVHQDDAVPVWIVAQQADISPYSLGTATLSLAKQARLVAGADIRNLKIDIQHANGGDMSLLDAGRDVVFSSSNHGLGIAGPGELIVAAGRHLDLGASAGIASLANTGNANLASSGANVTLLAGLGETGLEVGDYVYQYIDPQGGGPLALFGDAEALVKYRKDTAAAVGDYMRRTSGEALTDAQALEAYLALDNLHQAPFAYRHFSSELLAAGVAASQGEGYERGDQAIVVLFPGSDYFGNLSLYQSQVVTSRDASIDMLVPGGIINAGVPGSDSGEGIITEKGGDVRAFADGGFFVNQSKVITQYGGDITVWVSNGDIDAGRGSKTATSVPEKVVSTDAYGFTTVEFKGVATGSGIRAQTYDPDGPQADGEAPELGDVALLAPRGVLNAGEAGIAAGNLLAVAQQVLGAENITVSGTSVGVPTDTSGLAAPTQPTLPDAGKVTEEATKALAEQAGQSDQAANTASQALASFKPTFITVEVLGFGEGEGNREDRERGKGS